MARKSLTCSSTQGSETSLPGPAAALVAAGLSILALSCTPPARVEPSAVPAPAPPCAAGGELPFQVEADRACTLVYAAGLPLELNNPNLRGNGWNEATGILYSRLWQVGLDGRIEPDLVESHEVLDEGLTWRMVLREDVSWHDGRPLALADVRATLDEVFDPDVACDLDLNLPMVGAISYSGERTIEIRLKHPFPLLPVPLSEIAILPAADVAGDPERGRTSIHPPMGTGPYRFVRWRDDGAIELHPHEAFHLGRPAIPRIIMVPIAADEERARGVAEGRVDVAHVKPQHVGPIERRSNTWVVRMKSGAWRGMPLNLRRPYLQDLGVRRAIDLAIDREQVVLNALRGGGRPAYQPVPPESWAFSERLDVPYHDPHRALVLLDDAGWRVGEGGLRWRGRDPSIQVARASGEPVKNPPDTAEGPLTLRMIVWKDEAFRLRAAQIIKIHLRRVGIKVDLELVDNATYARLAEDMGTEYDAFIGGWGSLLDPGDNLYKKFHSGGSQNYMGYSNATVDRMLEECRTASDPEAAKDLYFRLMEHLRSEAVFLPLAYPDYLFGARTRVRGLEPAIVDSWYEFTRNAWRWRLEAE